MVHKKEEGTYHCIEKLMKDMPGFLSPGKGMPLLLIPECSGINKDWRIPDRSKTAHRKPPVKCFPTSSYFCFLTVIQMYFLLWFLFCKMNLCPLLTFNNNSNNNSKNSSFKELTFTTQDVGHTEVTLLSEESTPKLCVLTSNYVSLARI